MKSICFALAAATASTLAAGQEVGRVLSSTPVIQQVAVPQQVCSQQSYLVPGQSQGGGAAIGAIAGGAIGNAIGHGSGRAAATVLGILGGAVIGDRLEDPGRDQVQQVRNCTTQTHFENRLAHYDVVYEYGGRTYAVQMPNDPGPTVRLQVTPIGATLPSPVTAVPPAVYYDPVQITQTQTIVTPEPYFRAAVPVFITVPILSYGAYPRHYRGPRAAAYGYPPQHEPRWR
ncbi:MAG: glycine zipper 2TM domain-containing protein [Betaproteobacteria bacterium]